MKWIKIKQHLKDKMPKSFIEKYDKYLKYILNITALCVIILISWQIFKSIIFVIETTMMASNYDFSYKYEDLLEVLSAIFASHSSLIALAIMLNIYMLIKRKIGLYAFSIIIGLAFYLPIYQWLDNYIHPFLFKLHIYDFLLHSGQTILNPQYTKVFLLIIGIITLFIMCCFKKYRTTDRIFTALIVSAVLFTTFIFHIAIPIGYYKFERFEQTKILEQEILNQDVKEICKSRYCFMLDKKFQLINYPTTSQSQEIFSHYYFFINLSAKYLNKRDSFSQTLGDFKGQQFDYVISVITKKENEYLWVIDTNSLKKASRLSEIYFSFLCVVAHFIWIFGGVLLLFIHKKILFKRKSRVIMTKTQLKEKTYESNQ